MATADLKVDRVRPGTASRIARETVATLTGTTVRWDGAECVDGRDIYAIGFFQNIFTSDFSIYHYRYDNGTYYQVNKQTLSNATLRRQGMVFNGRDFIIPTDVGAVQAAGLLRINDWTFDNQYLFNNDDKAGIAFDGRNYYTYDVASGLIEEWHFTSDSNEYMTRSFNLPSSTNLFRATFDGRNLVVLQDHPVTGLAYRITYMRTGFGDDIFGYNVNTGADELVDISFDGRDLLIFYQDT